VESFTRRNTVAILSRAEPLGRRPPDLSGALEAFVQAHQHHAKIELAILRPVLWLIRRV
jgi:hypothetical protein